MACVATHAGCVRQSLATVSHWEYHLWGRFTPIGGVASFCVHETGWYDRHAFHRPWGATQPVQVCDKVSRCVAQEITTCQAKDSRFPREQALFGPSRTGRGVRDRVHPPCQMLLPLLSSPATCTHTCLPCDYAKKNNDCSDDPFL